MSGPIRLFVGSYPEFYDRLLVPVLFAPYARLLADRLRGMTVGNELEIAAGTGVVTRALVHTLPEAMNITAPSVDRAVLRRPRPPRRNPPHNVMDCLLELEPCQPAAVQLGPGRPAIVASLAQ